jgi:hypothetical protein
MGDIAAITGARITAAGMGAAAGPAAADSTDAERCGGLAARRYFMQGERLFAPEAMASIASLAGA